MKINKKLILISTALLAVSPIAAAPLTSNVQTSVAAATKSNATGSLKVIDSHIMLYNRSGNYLDHISAPKKGSTIKYYGKPFFKTVDPGDYSAGELYYPLRKNVYISSDYVTPISGPAYLTAIFNANIYNKSGKKVGFVKKGSVVKYAGKRKTTSSKAKYYYEAQKGKYRIPYTIINGKDYYYLGSGRYIKVANIGYIDGYRLTTHAPITVTVNKNTSTITKYVNSTGWGTDPNNIELKKG
ncbi:SLAP domain-containing protein [Lactobacillus crispatus]|nr:SLAP domain-containing protein [Lactobacillus crispatus]MDM8291292.1 SLAP domain-containing protein [Lactobacillus crispatus]